MKIKVHWLLEKFMFEDKQDKLKEAISNNGMDWKEIDSTFNSDDKKLINAFDEKECVICRGSIQFIRKIDRLCSWIPGTYCSYDNFKCSVYYPHFYSPDLLNQEFYMLPFGLLLEMKDKIYSEKNAVFIRPNSGTKVFAGQRVHITEFEDFIRTEETCYAVQPEEIVLISPTKKLFEEYRFIIADSKVITGSQYMLNSERNEKEDFDPEAEKFLKKVLDEVKFRPDRIFSADVARTQDGFKLIELNSFSSCGLYCANMDKVVKAVSQIAIEDYLDIYNI